MIRHLIIAFTLFAMGAAGCTQAGEPLQSTAASHRIHNEQMSVSWEPSQELFRLQQPPGKHFASLRFTEQVEHVRIADWRHATMGSGRAIECNLSDGGIGRIIVLDSQPFVFVQKAIANKTPDYMVVNQVQSFDLELTLDDSPKDLRALGTAGLTAVDKHPGSYAFLAVASPKTRTGVVSGWLTHDRGSGVLFSKIDNDAVRIVPRIDYGRLRIDGGATTDSEIFAVGLFDDARLGLEAYADAIVKCYDIKLRPILTGYCTWYSNPHGGASDEVHVAQLAASAAKKLKPYGFDFVQIDDKWQLGQRRNGPAKNFYTHHPDGPYPNGMKKTADNISKTGLMPGIWFMPFAGDHEDPFFKEHLDWFVKRADGTPYFARWGGTSLDMTNPDAKQYVRSIVSRIAHDWGYTYFKMDGLWTGTATQLRQRSNGYVDDDIGEAVFHDPNKTNIEAYRDGFKLVRDAAGDDVFFLGCNVSQNMRCMGSSFGMVDAMRIGPDNGSGWERLSRGPWHGTNRYFMHGRVWHNDPDCLHVRGSMPLSHAQVICSWVAITGQLNVFSEWLDGLPNERVDLLRRTMPNHGLKPRPVDLFENELSRVWLLTDDSSGVRRDVLGLFNWRESQPIEIDYSLSHIGLDPRKRYVGYDYWADRFVPPFADRLQCIVSGGMCRMLALRSESNHPQVVSTSRHITQGVVDITEESWDAESLTLKGSSKLVAADPYELRILVPIGQDSYQVTDVKLSPTAAKKFTFNQSGPKIRVRIDSQTGGTLNWNVQFKRAKIKNPPPPQSVTALRANVGYREVVLNWEAANASLFRITTSDGRALTTTQPHFIDSDLQASTKYRYNVAAVGWDGRLSQTAAVEVTTPKKLVITDPPPKPDISITKLKAVSARTRGSIGTNKTWEGKTLTLMGKTYADGIGVHANSTLVYAVPDGAKRLVATVGLDDEATVGLGYKQRTDPRSSIAAKIYGDAGEMGEPPVLLSKSPVLRDKTVRMWHFDLRLSTRIKTIRLVITDAEDGDCNDHADWVNTGFITSN